MHEEALIIVDMSNDFIADEGPLTVGTAGQMIVPYIRDLADAFLKEENFVVVAMDAHMPNDSHFDLWPPHNVIGTKGQQLYGELYDWYQANKQNKKVIDCPKTNYNAFFQTHLSETLRNANVRTVHVVGVATDICVFSTVSGADAEGFHTVTYKQGTATFTDLGEMMMDHMKRCFHTDVIE